MVRQASEDSDGDLTKRRDALQQLCETYWFPLYSFLRNKGYDSNTSADLVQGFLADLLRRDDLRSANPELGKFRSFLLAALKNYVNNVHDHQNAQKRGGNAKVISFDAEQADSRYRNEPIQSSTPESEFEKRWAMTLLERAQSDLQIYFESRGKGEQYERLKPFLGGKSDQKTVAEVSEELKMSEVAGKVAIHRMRQKFGEFLRKQIAQTVAKEDDIDGEIQQMFETLRG